jgi:hypothetical protein
MRSDMSFPQKQVAGLAPPLAGVANSHTTRLGSKHLHLLASQSL